MKTKQTTPVSLLPTRCFVRINILRAAVKSLTVAGTLRVPSAHVPRGLPAYANHFLLPYQHLPRSSEFYMVAGTLRVPSAHVSRGLPAYAHYFLLPYQHLPCRGEISRRQGVKIDSTRHRLTEVVLAVPIRGAAAAIIGARNLVSQCQTPN